LLRSWKLKFQEQGDGAFPGAGQRTAIEEEVRQLREENARLKMERDILKKATAFFARESR
jgi:transposase